MTDTVDQAYAACEAITREQARNFYYGIRLLPAAKRGALCALYALSRRIDDIGDGELPPAEKTVALARVRESLSHLDSSADPVLAAVAETARRYPVPLPAFGEIIDGVEMDLSGRVYGSFEELVEYCRCVAGAVGRLCLGVFGSGPDPKAPARADELGIALQQTNILRDIREDLINGRVYLPKEDLDRFGVTLRLDGAGRLDGNDGRLAALIRDASARNREWYARGWRLLPSLDRRSAACTAAMAGIYRRLLDRIETQPTTVYDKRLSLTGWQKAAVAARALSGASA